MIKCLAVDDEPLALSVLQKYIAAVPALELTGSCANAVEALQTLQQQTVDLLFLDIQMPQILGTDFMRTLKKPPKVIFTTAFRKYAVEGFELDAVDYLLKPISFERFLKAVNKVLQTNIEAISAEFQTQDNISEPANAAIYVRADRKMVKVLLNDILYIEGLNDYVKIITTGRTIVTKQLLSALEETLPKDLFIRIHRSFIAAISKIDSYNADFVEIGKRELPIGRLFKHDVARLLNSSSLGTSSQASSKNQNAEKKNKL
ncbi:MAG: LytTR family DNA-binding domain-containing protein [Bacteroidota bacterium]|nr:LytTR family DNA-binding domain-containing protein [Bacteroidota bacterium]